MNASLKNDLSTLSTINTYTLTRLINQINWCITDAVCKSVYEKDSEAVIDIGIGTLTIRFDSDQIRYKFVPSKQLEDAIVEAVVNEQNQLVDALKYSLVEKITNTYKSFF